jgi:hypothetical protein
MKATFAALAAALAACACASTRVTPVDMQGVTRVCIIENPRVKFDFLGAYRRALEERGFQVEVHPETTRLSVCPVTSRYTANWRWDLVLYLAYAELRVYRDARPAGRAIFNARSSRLIAAEATINDLVDGLFRR